MEMEVVDFFFYLGVLLVRDLLLEWGGNTVIEG